MKYSVLLPTLLLLAACSEEEPAGGALPMVFTATVREAEPQSRMAEYNDFRSIWEPGDVFKVKVANGDKEMETSCSIAGTGATITYDPPLYWKSDENAYVTAWYSNIYGQSTMAGNTVGLADQSRGLAYVLRATATADYGSRIQLDFIHQLAKIIIKVEGEGAADVKSVKVRNYTSCTVDDGIVTPGTPGLIATLSRGKGRFEAALVPDASISSDFISIDNALDVEINGITALNAGKVYTITINADYPVKEDPANGREAVLMRESTPDQPALYFATCNIGADAPRIIN